MTSPRLSDQDAANRKVRSALKERLHEIEPGAFEAIIGKLLSALGYQDVSITKQSGDGGIDLTGTTTAGGIADLQMAVQVKRWRTNVSVPVIRDLRGGLDPHQRGVVITLSDFTRLAREEARKPNRSPIDLINGDELLELLVENDIGVTRKGITVLELDEGSLSPPDWLEETPRTGEGEADKEPPQIVRRRPRKERFTIFSLPGGVDAWKESLDDMLRYVMDETPTKAEAAEWMVDRFAKVNSPKSVRDYWNVPIGNLGLVSVRNERLTLTDTGAEYATDFDPDDLLKLLESRTEGVFEILAYLADRPHTTAEIHARLNVDRDPEKRWQTDTQPRYRLDWLKVLGAVRKNGAMWELAATPPTA